MLYAVAALALRRPGGEYRCGRGLRDLLMVAFMTTIGLSARLQLIREGGARVVWFLGIASLGAVLQNLLGIALAHGAGSGPATGNSDGVGGAGGRAGDGTGIRRHVREDGRAGRDDGGVRGGDIRDYGGGADLAATSAGG